MIRRIFYDLRTRRFVEFLIVHAVVSVAAAAMALKGHEIAADHPLRPYVVGAVEYFFSSLAGASLGLLLLLKWLFFGYAATGAVHVLSQNISLPLAAGVPALLGIVCLAVGSRSKAGWYATYLAFAFASALFIVAAHNCFIEIGNIRLLAR